MGSKYNKKRLGERRGEGAIGLVDSSMYGDQEQGREWEGVEEKRNLGHWLEALAVLAQEMASAPVGTVRVVLVMSKASWLQRAASSRQAHHNHLLTNDRGVSAMTREALQGSGVVGSGSGGDMGMNRENQR